jgi:hypothetical protein
MKYSVFAGVLPEVCQRLAKHSYDDVSARPDRRHRLT